MKKWLTKANIMNPHARMVCGFQPPFEADFEAMKVILREFDQAKEYNFIYEDNDVIVYEYKNLLQQSPFRYWDIKYIAQLLRYEAWLVVSGLIVVNNDRQLNIQIRNAKRSLVKAIKDIWGVTLKRRVDHGQESSD